ncbi:hypothetical protein ILYODFUR_024658 [Ilyodon furcidens]|uniref:Uncharacterized protein n=1 Tax=Ilyodon furcidens TaxID=33524 RepID=A0ABV0UL15_9TELE
MLDISFKTSIHSSIHVLYPLLPYRVTWELQRSSGRVDPGQAGPTQKHTRQTTTHTPKGNLERQINLTVMLCGRKPEDPERACKTPGWESNSGPSCCKETVLPTVPPCSPSFETAQEILLFSLSRVVSIFEY